MILRISTLAVLIFSLLCIPATAQDTLSINLNQFIERGLEKSGQVSYENRSVDLAQNRARQARSQRIFPRFELNTTHGVVPGVKSPLGLPPGQFYLDPNLENDWEDWAIFTRAEINAVQPVYTWGAVRKAIDAAEAGARAEEFRFDAAKAEVELQLYELYFSYLLALEIERILVDANDQIRRVERQIEQMREDGDPNLKESDVFKFEIFKAEFVVQKTEVEQSVNSIERIWSYILDEGTQTRYIPAERFLDPVPFELENYEFYEQLAMNDRPELRGVAQGINALKKSTEAVRAQQYPVLFLGITASYANTPNRPRQTNPFIINNTNFANAGIGFGIRQNLNFSSMRSSIERADIEYRRVNDLRDALTDGIVLELNEKYREATVAEVRVRQTEESLTIARNWVRHEQLNYDIGFGDVEDLLDAVQNELELRLKMKQNTFDLNKRVAALYKTAGIPISKLGTN